MSRKKLAMANLQDNHKNWEKQITAITWQKIEIDINVLKIQLTLMLHVRDIIDIQWMLLKGLIKWEEG